MHINDTDNGRHFPKQSADFWCKFLFQLSAHTSADHESTMTMPLNEWFVRLKHGDIIWQNDSYTSLHVLWSAATVQTVLFNDIIFAWKTFAIETYGQRMN